MLQVRLVLDAHLRPSQRPSENLDILLVKLLLVGHNQEIITVHSKFDITLDVTEVAHGPASLDEPNAIEILGVSLRPFLSRITCTIISSVAARPLSLRHLVPSPRLESGYTALSCILRRSRPY